MIKKLILASAISFSLTYNAQVTSGLVAKYSFNSGNANDEIGLNNGTVNGAILTADRFGNTNKAYSLSGGKYITLPNAVALKSATMTVSLWVKVNGYEPSSFSNNCIYGVINSSTAAYFGSFYMSINTTDGKYFSTTQNNSGQSLFGTSINPKNSNWQHYVLATDNDSTKMYIDGVKQWSMFKNFTSTFSGDSIYIGSTGNTTYTGGLNGLIDDIRVYNRVLLQSEITTLYNEPDPMTVGVNENNLDRTNVSVFPNPNNGTFTVKSAKNEHITITNELGQVIKFIDLNKQNDFSFEIINLKSGIYFLIGESTKHKIVVTQ